MLGGRWVNRWYWGGVFFGYEMGWLFDGVVGNLGGVYGI